MTNDEPPSDAPKSMEVLEPGINFFNREMRFDADNFPPSGLTGDAV